MRGFDRLWRSPSRIDERDLADPRSFIRFGREPLAVDILPGINGIGFDEAWERRVEAVIDPDTGHTAFFISKLDLIYCQIGCWTIARADVEDLRQAEIPEI